MRKQRYVWAKEHEYCSVELLRTVIFSNETIFGNFGSDGIHPVWRRSGERFSGGCLLITKRQPGRKIVCGCFSYNGIKSINLVEGRVKSEAFIKVLQTNLTPCIEELYKPKRRHLFACHSGLATVNVANIHTDNLEHFFNYNFIGHIIFEYSTIFDAFTKPLA